MLYVLLSIISNFLNTDHEYGGIYGGGKIFQEQNGRMLKYSRMNGANYCELNFI